MLKLEKISRDGTIHISMRHRERFFNKVFIQAFGVAAAWHLLAFLFFQIGGLKLLEGETLFPPVAVNADIHPEVADDNAVIQAVIYEEQRYHELALAPPLSEPVIPEIKVLIPPLSFHLEEVKYQTVNPFEKVEQDIQDLYFQAVEKPKIAKPFTIHVSGPISHRFKEESVSKIESLIQDRPAGRWVFSVQVDDLNGSIFWHHTHSILNPQDAALANQILSILEFEPDSSSFISSAEIEMVFGSNGEIR